MGSSFDNVYPVYHQILLSTTVAAKWWFCNSVVPSTLYCKEHLSFLSFYQCGLMGPYFILRVIICYYCYLIFKLSQFWLVGVPSAWTLWLMELSLLSSEYFLAFGTAGCPGSSHFPSSGERYLKTRVWGQGCTLWLGCHCF